MVEINIADYVSDKEYSGDDVLVTYELPVKPYTDIYGFATGETTPKFIKSTGNLHFWQDTITESAYIFNNYGHCYSYGDEIDFTENTERYTVTFDYLDDYEETLSYTHVEINGVVYPLVWSPYCDDRSAKATVDGFDGLEFHWEFGLGFWYNLSKDYELLDDIFFGGLEEVTQSVAQYERISGATWVLGMQDSNPRVIDVSDIRSGYGFTLDFNVRTQINIDGQISVPSSTYTAYWLDGDYKHINTTSHAVDYTDMDFEDGVSINFSIPFTVPDGAEYMYVRFNTGYFYVNECWEVSWQVRSVRMQATLSAIEDNTKTMQNVTTKLNQISNKLDQNQQEEEKQTGLLQNLVTEVKELPGAIGNKIKEAVTDLFIPDTEAIVEQKDKWDELLADRFGAVYEAGSIASDIAEAFVPGETQQMISFPATTFDLAGAEFVFGGWEIDVVPDGFEFAIDTLKMIINIACTLLFVNALKNRFENTLDGDD